MPNIKVNLQLVHTVLQHWTQNTGNVHTMLFWWTISQARHDYTYSQPELTVSHALDA